MSERAPGESPVESPWQRLHRLVERQRGELGLTQDGIQAAGGPSSRWVQQLRLREGAPSDRMRTPMRKLDRALEWDTDTSWRIAHGWATVSANEKAPNARKRSALSVAVAGQLRAERAIANLTIDELAKRSGVSRNALLAVLNGQRPADVSQLAAICAALGVSVVDVVARAVERIDEVTP